MLKPEDNYLNKMSQNGKPLNPVVLFILGMLAGLLIYWLFIDTDTDNTVCENAQPAAEEKAPDAAQASAGNAVQPPIGADPAAAAAVQPPLAAIPAQPAPEALPQNVHYIGGEIEHSLYRSVASRFPEDDASKLLAEKISAHIKRLLVFDLDTTRQLRKGDRFDVIYEETEESTDGLRILAVRYKSQYHFKTFESYYYRHEGEEFGHHYDAEGVESQERLKNGPLKDYEEVTSLLNDRRPRHDGVDLKAPIWTKVYLPFDAKLNRINWNTRYNGNCAEFTYLHDGMKMIMLHLEKFPEGITPGKTYKAGTHVANVGNTGRSSASHLHYQIETPAGKIIDPFKYHGSYRPKLESPQLEEFKAMVEKLQAQMENGRVQDDARAEQQATETTGAEAAAADEAAPAAGQQL